MSHSTVWWLIAGAAIVVELLSGTVYLLLLSAGFAAAALSAHAGAGVTVQLVVAAVVGVGAVLIWHALRGRRPATPAAVTRMGRVPRDRESKTSNGPTPVAQHNMDPS